MKELIISIDNSLLEKFNIALSLNNDDKDQVLSYLIKEYISKAFLNASKNINEESKLNDENESIIVNKKTIIEDDNYNNYLDPNSEKYGKAINRIPKWAYNKDQYNHKIIKAFFEIEQEDGEVYKDDLRRRCTNRITYPNTYCPTFEANYSSMKTDSGNSHGKVFVEDNAKVYIWDEVKDMLIKYKRHFVE